MLLHHVDSGRSVSIEDGSVNGAMLVMGNTVMAFRVVAGGPLSDQSAHEDIVQAQHNGVANHGNQRTVKGDVGLGEVGHADSFAVPLERLLKLTQRHGVGADRGLPRGTHLDELPHLLEMGAGLRVTENIEDQVTGFPQNILDRRPSGTGSVAGLGRGIAQHLQLGQGLADSGPRSPKTLTQLALGRQRRPNGKRS